MMRLSGYLRTERHRRGHGFTLVELAVVLAILAVIIPLTIVWSADMLQSTDDAFLRLRSTQATDDVGRQLTEDLESARSCETTLLDPPVISISPTQLEFISDIDGDGDGDYVKYAVVGDEIQRTTDTVGDAANPCVFTEHLSAPQVLATMPAGASAQFVAHLGSTDVTSRTCRGLTSNFDQCSFTSISVILEIASLRPNSPDSTVEREIPLSSRWGRT